MVKSSKIFVAYRALGFVCNHVPLSLRYIKSRQENLVVTSVGKSFHTYGCSSFGLLNVSGQHPEDISCLTSDANLVFTACKNVIYAWKRGTELKHTYEGPAENVFLLLPFGHHLLAVYENSTLIAWDIKGEEMMLEIPSSDLRISTLVHPSTYLNKILMGSVEGCLKLWNLKTNQLIYTFSGWGSPVTVLEQAPAIHVVAIGLECGDIYIHNLKFDETIMKFSQDWGAVTAISFRTDGPALMASASTMGHVAVWDLEKKRLHSEMRDAHKASISGMKFLPNEPLLVTSSSDNSIKMWIFDLPDQGGRLLRVRDGHSGPPTKVRFYKNDGKHILSAGLDSTLRSFTTWGDGANRSFGQASLNKKKGSKRKGAAASDPLIMPPVMDFSCEPTREKDWDNVAAVHRHSELVTTWSYDRACMGQHKLRHERFKGVKQISALCLTISSCGNFVIIGYSTGHLDKYNIQSGIFRGSFGDDKAHDGNVRGIAVDGLNQLVVSGGSDKLLKFWRFKEYGLVRALELTESVAKMILHRESAMLAVALDDFSVVIVDMEAKRIVRKFEENEGNVSDMSFSADSRWLTAATMDSSIKTWDLITGKLIDYFTVSPICVSVSMSPSGEYLATAHVGSLGVYLWANATLYSHVSLHPLPHDYDPLALELPLVTLDERNDEDEDTEEEADAVEVDEFKSPEQIADELVTLSLLPQSHWLNLLDLDIIKLRNKPKEPVKVPKNAPFFLPVVTGLKPTFFIEEEQISKEIQNEKTKVLKVMQKGSEFVKMLEKNYEAQNYSAVVENMKLMSPSQIDVEVRCLGPECGGSHRLMECFLRCMAGALGTNRNFELIHSYLALFLQIHYEVVAASENLRESLREIHQTKAWESLQERINFCLCIGNYARSAVI